MAETASQLFLLRLSRRASSAMIFVAGLVLTGWLLHLQILKSAWPGLIAMNPLTALLFAPVISTAQVPNQFDFAVYAPGSGCAALAR